MTMIHNHNHQHQHSQLPHSSHHSTMYDNWFHHNNNYHDQFRYHSSSSTMGHYNNTTHTHHHHHQQQQQQQQHYSTMNSSNNSSFDHHPSAATTCSSSSLLGLLNAPVVVVSPQQQQQPQVPFQYVQQVQTQPQHQNNFYHQGHFPQQAPVQALVVAPTSYQSESSSSYNNNNNHHQSYSSYSYNSTTGGCGGGGTSQMGMLPIYNEQANHLSSLTSDFMSTIPCGDHHHHPHHRATTTTTTTTTVDPQQLSMPLFEHFNHSQEDICDYEYIIKSNNNHYQDDHFEDLTDLSVGGSTRDESLSGSPTSSVSSNCISPSASPLLYNKLFEEFPQLPSFPQPELQHLHTGVVELPPFNEEEPRTSPRAPYRELPQEQVIVLSQGNINNNNHCEQPSQQDTRDVIVASPVSSCEDEDSRSIKTEDDCTEQLTTPEPEVRTSSRGKRKAAVAISSSQKGSPPSKKIKKDPSISATTMVSSTNPLHMVRYMAQEEIQKIVVTLTKVKPNVKKGTAKAESSRRSVTKTYFEYEDIETQKTGTRVIRTGNKGGVNSTRIKYALFSPVPNDCQISQLSVRAYDLPNATFEDDEKIQVECAHIYQCHTPDRGIVSYAYFVLRFDLSQDASKNREHQIHVCRDHVSLRMSASCKFVSGRGDKRILVKKPLSTMDESALKQYRIIKITE